MTKFLITIFVLFTGVKLSAQDKLRMYKEKADNYILQKIDRSLIDDISISSVFITQKDSARSAFIDFEPNRNKNIAFETSTFFYDFYCKALDLTFFFGIKIGKDKIIITDSSAFLSIPECVMQNKACNYISKDSAMKIALLDSISFAYNLNASLIRTYKSKIFYWLVKGSPIKQQGKPLNAEETGIGRRRLIDAATGKIISR